MAEDNATNQRVAQLILESAGHSVTIVGDGEAALDALDKSTFDIALFDLSMPKVSGLEALKLYRFTTPRPIPVLILSANVTKETIAECENAGAAEFIAKPLRASHLLETIEKHFPGVLMDQPEIQVPAELGQKPALEIVDNPIIDKTVLDDLARLSSDPTFIVRLIEGFFSDADRLSQEIVDAIANGALSSSETSRMPLREAPPALARCDGFNLLSDWRKLHTIPFA